MKTKLMKFVRKPFVQNVIILSSGTVVAQIIAFVLTPVITRLYGPESYGLMGTFLAIVAIFVPIASFAYPIAIVLPKKEEEAKSLIRLSLWISTVFSLFVGILLMLLNEPIVHLFSIEEISSYLYLIPVVIFFAGILQVIEKWLIRNGLFTISAKAMVSQSLVMYGGQAALGYFHPIAPFLIIFAALKEGLRAFFMFIYSGGYKKYKSIFLDRNKISIKLVAKKYRDFPIFRAPEVTLSALTSSLPILLLTTFFGPVSAGYYTITRMVLSVPTQLLGKSVGDVFYPRISNAAHNNENLKKLISKATLSLAAIGVIPYLAIIIFGPWMFGVVFGDEWVRAGEYARWIAIGSFFGFINQPSVRSLPVLSAQAFHLKYTITLLIIRFTMLMIGYYLFSSDIVAVALFGLSGAILNLILISITLHKSKQFI